MFIVDKYFFNFIYLLVIKTL